MVKIEGDYFKKVISKNQEQHIQQAIERKEEAMCQNDAFKRKLENEKYMKMLLKK